MISLYARYRGETGSCRCLRRVVGRASGGWDNLSPLVSRGWLAYGEAAHRVRESGLATFQFHDAVGHQAAEGVVGWERAVDAAQSLECLGDLAVERERLGQAELGLEVIGLQVKGDLGVVQRSGCVAVGQQRRHVCVGLPIGGGRAPGLGETC